MILDCDVSRKGAAARARPMGMLSWLTGGVVSEQQLRDPLREDRL